MVSVGPVGPSSFTGPKKTLRSSSDQSTGQSTDQAKIHDAQADVTNAVAQIQEQSKQVAHEGQAQIDHLKENYEHEFLTESAREENQIANEKLKGYEKLRDLQRTQNAEISRVKREGEAELARLNNYYRDTTYNAEQRGDELLRSVESKNQQRLNFENKTGGAAADQIRHDKNIEIEQLQADRDLQIPTLEKQAHDLYDKKRVETEAAITKSSEKLDSNYHDIEKSHQDSMARLTNETYAQLQKARLDSSRKLSAYGERQSDPFYKLMDLQAEFEDQGDKYVLTARVPEHEQRNVTVAIRGNQVVLSGTRKNEERVELEPGHEKGTSSYQSFMESFAFTHPVENSMLTHEFKGDRVIVTVPKKLLASEYHPHKMKPARTQVQKPDFPANLPHVGDEFTPQGEIAGTTGSRPLVKE